MVLDAILAYLHFIAIFILFAFLTVQLVLLGRPLDARAIRLLACDVNDDFTEQYQATAAQPQPLFRRRARA